MSNGMRSCAQRARGVDRLSRTFEGARSIFFCFGLLFASEALAVKVPVSCFIREVGGSGGSLSLYWVQNNPVSPWYLGEASLLGQPISSCTQYTDRLRAAVMQTIYGNLASDLTLQNQYPIPDSYEFLGSVIPPINTDIGSFPNICYFAFGLNSFSVGLYGYGVGLSVDCNTSFNRKNLGKSRINECFVGNPINQGTGNKYQSEVDYAAIGSFPIKFIRHYNSTLGPHSSYWSNNYSEHVQVNSATAVNIIRADGKSYPFSLANGSWSSDADVNGKLTEQTDGAGNPIGWQYTNSDDQIEIYDGSGKLLSVSDRAGQTQTLGYSDSNTPPAIAPFSGLLIQVKDAHRRQINLTYDSLGRMVSMVDSANGAYNYGYDQLSNLTSVAYPDGMNRPGF